jgi:hypothetical protein
MATPRLGKLLASRFYSAAHRIVTFPIARREGVAIQRPKLALFPTADIGRTWRTWIVGALSAVASRLVSIYPCLAVHGYEYPGEKNTVNDRAGMFGGFVFLRTISNWASVASLACLSHNLAPCLHKCPRYLPFPTVSAGGRGPAASLTCTAHL